MLLAQVGMPLMSGRDCGFARAKAARRRGRNCLCILSAGIEKGVLIRLTSGCLSAALVNVNESEGCNDRLWLGIRHE